MLGAPARSLVLWFPDWPVTAWLRDTAASSGSFATLEVALHAAPPVAVVANNVVVACSPAARSEGVRRGQRRRDAQARCPRLRIVPADPARDQRAFAPVVSAIEERAPGVQIIRPGLCALRARGPARFYGGEAEAARVLLEGLAAQGFAGVRAGVADGPFTAEQAARRGVPVRGASGVPGAPGDSVAPGAPVCVVPAGASGEFLAPLPVAVLADAGFSAGPELIELLAQLGVRSLGDFAALEADRVRERFGDRGIRLHELAAGCDSRAVDPRVPPPELHREIAFEPPLELADQVAFGMRITAESFIDGIAAERLVCTELRVELTGERGERSERVWLHPASFDAGAVVDRVRWQLGEAQGAGAFRSGIALVHIAPEAVDEASHHTPAIFGTGAEERVHHALSRVQAMLGHRGVLTSTIGGGRWLAERQVLVPWGDRVVLAKERARPWPGTLPDPLPTTVFPEPREVEVTTRGGGPVAVGERGARTAEPAVLIVGERTLEITAWAGPWPVIERGWDALRGRHAHRFQLVDAGQIAWLVIWENDEWRAEARYD